MSERYWVICFYDEAAGQASDFATLCEAQAACVGIELCKQNAMGFVYDVETEDICWPTDEDVGDDAYMVAVRSAAKVKINSKLGRAAS